MKIRAKSRGLFRNKRVRPGDVITDYPDDSPVPEWAVLLDSPAAKAPKPKPPETLGQITKAVAAADAKVIEKKGG